MKFRNNRRSILARVLAIFLLTILAVFITGGFLLWKKLKPHYPWLPNYIKRELTSNPVNQVKAPKHILFLFVDHWEPLNDEIVQDWAEQYVKFSEPHRDADGIRPQHTWFWMFFKADQEKSLGYLKTLSGLAYQRLGEVEKHLHHDNDTGPGFIEKMSAAQALANMTGANITAESTPRKTFGFIHGRWALDNSRGDASCHVNNELILLRELGCYADFTMPAWGRMHSKMVNVLYYATDDPEKPKSYDSGIPVSVGKPGVGDIFMFTGQSVVSFNGLKPVYDHGEIDENNLPTQKRIDSWIAKGVHVEGMPEWIFVKVFTHGCVPTTAPIVLGKWRSEMHDYLEKRYNDGSEWVLHYVTAREAYNIAKAAEAGKSGNPNEYRNYLIPPYVNRYLVSSAPFDTISFENEKAVLRIHGKPDSKAAIRIRAHNVFVSGGAEIVASQSFKDETLLTLRLKDEGVIGLTYSGLGTELIEVSQATVENKPAPETKGSK